MPTATFRLRASGRVRSMASSFGACRAWAWVVGTRIVCKSFVQYVNTGFHSVGTFNIPRGVATREEGRKPLFLFCFVLMEGIFFPLLSS